MSSYAKSLPQTLRLACEVLQQSIGDHDELRTASTRLLVLPLTLQVVATSAAAEQAGMNKKKQQQRELFISPVSQARRLRQSHNAMHTRSFLLGIL